ncbi:MAG: cytochrome b/b6 domain-containing protein [Gammaproteobacteria bacterium]|nr:cytochrome b/b6 domain-containing protein [Gammaproteobacteria bacterium]
MEHDNRVKVWDSFVRIFHWSLVTAFVVAYVTEEDVLSVHTLAGYIVFGLIILRLIWGFIGTPHARFTDFTYSPSSIRTFLTDTLYLRAKRYLGHNPAGGAMIFLLLASLLMTLFSGIAVYGAENNGPLAALLGGSGEFIKEALEEAHEFFANFTLLLVFIHIGGVVVESLIHRENLPASMVHGYKRVEEEDQV